jgi:GxxExxY protein
MNQRKRQDQAQSRPLASEQVTGAIIGAFYESYNVLGFGFLESVYRNALAGELRKTGLHVLQETPIEVTYKDARVGWFRLDLLVERAVAVEVKAATTLGPTDKQQLLNYLRATSLDVGLLLHYGPEPKFHRLVSPRLVVAERR